MTPGLVDTEDANQQVLPGDWREVPGAVYNLPPTRPRNSSDVAKANRLVMADYLVSDEGAVPWRVNSVTYAYHDPRG